MALKVRKVKLLLCNFFQKRKIFEVLVLGEMDRAESSYEAMCFVTELEEEEFISSDAMSKLRQVSFLISQKYSENKPCADIKILFCGGGRVKPWSNGSTNSGKLN